MKTKNYLLLLIFSFSLTSIFSQDNPDEMKDDGPKIELGLNATTLLKGIFGGENSINSAPHALMVNFALSDDIFLRTAYFFNYSVVDNPFESRKTTFTDYGLRLGFQKNIKAGNNAEIYMGIDMIADYFSSKTESILNTQPNSTFDSSNTSRELGIGPILGFSYDLSSVLSVRTETALYASTGESISRFQQFGFPTTTQEVKQSSKNVRLITPTALLLFFRF